MGKFEPVSSSIIKKRGEGFETSGTDAKGGSGSGSEDLSSTSSGLLKSVTALSLPVLSDIISKPLSVCAVEA